MKINRKDLNQFMKSIRLNPDRKELTDEQLVDQLATYMETNPSCVEVHEVSNPGRFYYSTVGYGVLSLMGEKYRMGRIEVFDEEDRSGYPVTEGIYTMPHIAASQFEDFIDSLETELPINIEIGSHEWCERECARALGFETPEELRDPHKVKEYRRKKNDEYRRKRNDIHAQEKGYKDWDELMAKGNGIGKENC